jgi:hypothetical protein
MRGVTKNLGEISVKDEARQSKRIKLLLELINSLNTIESQKQRD